MRSCRLAFVAFLCMATAVSFAEIKYTVAPNSAANRLTVTMSFDAKAGDLELQMPNWSPGAYILGEPGRNVKDLKISVGSSGVGAKFTPNNSWKTALPWAGKVTVTYTVPTNMEEGAIHYSGPSTYLYVVGRKEEKCTLAFDVPKEWKIAVGLDQIGRDDRAYKAPNYDVLADNPVTMGDYIELSYKSFGKPHTIAIRGTNKGKVDPKKIVEKCKAVSDSQGDFFGGLPFNKYVWHFSVFNMPDGAGGLEHLTSTQITLGYDVGPRAVSVLSHEYFHLWNVKRIRSAVLGPFDYTQLPKTGALYWLEGTTDYYASLLNHRYGISDQAEFLADIVRNTQSVRNNPSRLTVSPYESSMRVGEANNGRGNSDGYQISYYNLGWLVGLALDIEIRSRTGGKRSLDDVTLALWNMTKNDKPGFKEDEIRRQCIKFGGKEMGAFFDRVVMQAGELPLEDCLAKVGFALSSVQEPYNDPGFTFGRMFRSPGVRISGITANGTNSGLQENDVIVEIGGVAVDTSEGKNPQGQVGDWVKSLTPGTAVSLVVMRGENKITASVTPAAAYRTIWKVTDMEPTDPAVLALRNGWFFAGKK